MKHYIRVRTFVAVSLTLGLVVGCGGGGGGGDSSPNTSLSPETGEVMARNVSGALPGCTYTSAGSTSNRSNDVVVRLYKKTVNGIVSKSKSKLRARAVNAREINEETAGTCLGSPGSFTEIGTHESGVDDVTYTFNDYCTTNDEGSSTIAGTLIVKAVGEPSPSGPVPQYTTVSTGSGGLQIAEFTSEGTFNHSATIDDFKFTYGNGGETPTEAKPNRHEIDSLVIIDGRDNNEFNVSNVDISQYNSGTSNVIQIISTTYTDPDTGSVDISTTPLTIDENGVFISGTITATGDDNSTLVLGKSSSVENGFDVVVGEQTLGAVDCSGF